MLVLVLRNWVAAPFPPVRILSASEKLICWMAFLKMGKAFAAASSAPWFIAAMVLSSSLPTAALSSALFRIFCSRD